MKESKKPVLSSLTANRFLRLCDGVFSTAVLVLSLRFLVMSATPSATGLLGALFIFLTASKVISAFSLHRKGDRMMSVNAFAAAGCLAICAVLVFIFGATHRMTCIAGLVYIFSIIATRILKIVRDHSLRSVIFNVVFILALLFFGSVFISDESYFSYVTLSLSFTLAAQSLCHIIMICFSQIKLNILIKILRKTFAAEILFGLVLLIVAFSFVFSAFEPAIESYGDALWYCFAVVTTIGFGDFTVTSIAARVLSVILGVYGIIVVALITSVIVNFYNEVKNDTDQPGGQ